MRHIVVRQRKVKGVLLRNKSYWDVISACARIGVIVSAVIRRPIKIPSASVVWDGIVASSLFSNPKDGRHDIRFPRVTLDRWVRTGRDEDLRFYLKQCLLSQFHRVLGEVCCGRVWGSGLFVPEDFRGASNCKTETNREKSLHADRHFFYPILPSKASLKFSEVWPSRG